MTLFAGLLVQATERPALAVEILIGIDVPATLDGLQLRSYDVIRSLDGLHELDVRLASQLELGSLHLRDDGDRLFSPLDPVELGGILFDPRQVVAFDGAGYSLAFDGESAGLALGVRIDALFLDGADVVLSLDESVDLGGTVYRPTDLLRHDGAAFSLYWDSAAAGVPAEANVIAADLDGAGILVIAFEDPIELGGTAYRSGDLVSWNGADFRLYFADPNWGVGIELAGLHVVDATGSGDFDGDRFASSLDCDDDDDGVYALPGEASDLGFGDNKSTMSFSSPQLSGLLQGSLAHGILRSESPSEFLSASTCLVAGDSGTVVDDFDIPPAGSGRYYLAWAINPCGRSSLGVGSDGKPRDGVSCP